MTTLGKAYEQWLKLQPWDEQTQHKIRQRFTIDFNYNSNHIEGNTLTYGQTELLLLFGKVSGEARMKDCEDMKASNICLRMTEEEALAYDKPLTQSFIRLLHKTLLREDYEVHHQLPGGGNVSYTIHAGQYKTRPNSVFTPTGERFDYASPEETLALMTDLVDWYNNAERTRAMSPVELAALFHYRYVRIHPFEDGNGRLARLLSNYILLRHRYPMVVVRSRKKRDYLNALATSDKVVGATPSKGAHATLREIRHFLDYFTKLTTEAIDAEVRFATIHDGRIWWHDGEMVRFRTETRGRILSAIMTNTSISTKEISELTGVNVAAVNKHLKALADRQYIQRKGDGDWHVIIYPSL